MSLPRFFCAHAQAPREGLEVALDAAQARHLKVLRLRAGEALEVVLPEGAWRADLAFLDRDRASVRLAWPLDESREPAHLLHALPPVTAQASLLDEMLPPLVELGVARITPVAYARGTEALRAAARMERWSRIVLGACEQSHRTRVPILEAPIPFEALLEVRADQRWVAYEVPTGRGNPPWRPGSLAFTSGPEGGITEGEWRALEGAGWAPVSLGPAILRAVTAPVALAAAAQFQMGLP